MHEKSESAVIAGVAIVGGLFVAFVVALAIWTNAAMKDIEARAQEDEARAYRGWVKVTGLSDVSFGEWASMRRYGGVPQTIPAKDAERK